MEYLLKNYTGEHWKKLNIVNSKKPHNIYSISSIGRVMSYDPTHKTNKYKVNRELDSRTCEWGYVYWSCDGKNYKVHRLVASYFIEDNLSSRLHVHHKNGIPNDNRVENLEWISPTEHVRLEIELGKRKQLKEYSIHQRKYSWEMVCYMRHLHEDIGWSMNQISGLFNIKFGTMKQILQYESYKRPY